QSAAALVAVYGEGNLRRSGALSSDPLDERDRLSVCRRRVWLIYMNRNASPGLGQWVTVSLMVAVSLFLLYKLYQYAGTRTEFPTGLTIGSVEVGQMTPEEARVELTTHYLDAPVTIYHGENQFDLMPSQAEFTLDFDLMLHNADLERTRQDFWSGFWGFL